MKSNGTFMQKHFFLMVKMAKYGGVSLFCSACLCLSSFDQVTQGPVVTVSVFLDAGFCFYDKTC